MLLLIDNFDSFTHNLVHAFQKLGQQVHVQRNQRAPMLSSFDFLVIGPGPGTPSKAGLSKKIIIEQAGVIPILGVCLGHQAIGEVFGAKIVRSQMPMHGKCSSISHHQQGIFKNIPTPFKATRYHSLVIDPSSVPQSLEVTAWTTQHEIMAIRHKTLHIEGVQFHPESVASEYGMELFWNFIHRAP
jgi:anthranilate synthase component II